MAEKFTVTKTIGNDVEILKQFETLREAVEYAKELKTPRSEGLVAVWRIESPTKHRFYGCYNIYR